MVSHPSLGFYPEITDSCERAEDRLLPGNPSPQPEGLAFMDAAFVTLFLVESVDSAIEEVVAVAVYGKLPKEDKRAWHVISLKAAP